MHRCNHPLTVCCSKSLEINPVSCEEALPFEIRLLVIIAIEAQHVRS
jgi:hypothetical protein